MKRFVIASLVSIASFSALAAERQISDLMYLPNQGTKFGETGLGIVAGNAKTDEGRSFYMGYAIQQNLGYAITNNLSLTLSLSLAHVDVKTRTGGTSSFTTQAGIQEPTVDVRFRALEGDTILDVVGKAQVKIGDSELDGSRTNSLEGNNALGVDLNLGQKKGNWQYFAVAGVEYDMESTTKLKGRSGSGKVKRKTHYDYNVGLNAQYKSSETLFFRAGIDAEMEPKVKYKNDAAEKDDARINLDYKISALYVVNKDLMLNFGYMLSDVKTKDVRNWALSTVSASALYQF